MPQNAAAFTVRMSTSEGDRSGMPQFAAEFAMRMGAEDGDLPGMPKSATQVQWRMVDPSVARERGVRAAGGAGALALLEEV